MSSQKTVRRVQLDLPPSSMATLEKLKEQMEATSYAEVIRRALRLCDVLQTQSANGSIVFLRDDGTQEKIILL